MFIFEQKMFFLTFYKKQILLFLRGIKEIYLFFTYNPVLFVMLLTKAVFT